MDLVDKDIIQEGVVNPDLVQMRLFGFFLRHFLFEFARSWDEQVIINQEIFVVHFFCRFIVLSFVMQNVMKQCIANTLGLGFLIQFEITKFTLSTIY
jgi:hypothetical protein